MAPLGQVTRRFDGSYRGLSRGAPGTYTPENATNGRSWALSMTGGSIVGLTGAIVGNMLTPDKALSTLPIAV